MLRSRRFFRKAFQASIRRQSQRWSYGAVLLLLAALLLAQFVGKNGDAARPRAADAVLTSWLAGVQHVVDNAARQVDGVQGWWNAGQETPKLVQENQLLREKLRVAEQAVQENDALRQLLHMQPERGEQIAGARVIGFGGVTADQELLINAGQGAGVKVDDLAFDARGLVGRVIQVNESSARVLLLTHPDSKLPVIVQDQAAEGAAPENAAKPVASTRAMLVGNGGGGVVGSGRGSGGVLHYVQQPGVIRAGQVVVTAGIGDGIPYGLVLGAVLPDHSNKDQPLVALRASTTASHLQLVRYGTVTPLYSSVN
jgi:rod shape-determining protein MreC